MGLRTNTYRLSAYPDSCLESELGKVGLGQIESCQVKSSQVKVSQVKVSQVKSSQGKSGLISHITLSTELCDTYTCHHYLILAAVRWP